MHVLEAWHLQPPTWIPEIPHRQRVFPGNWQNVEQLHVQTGFMTYCASEQHELFKIRFFETKNVFNEKKLLISWKIQEAEYKNAVDFNANDDSYDLW